MMKTAMLICISAAAFSHERALCCDTAKAQDLRQYYEASAEASGSLVLRGLPIVVVVLPDKPYSAENSYLASALELLERHPTFKPNKVKFWRPTIEQAKLGFRTVLRKAPTSLQNAIGQQSPKLACQVLGIELNGKRIKLYNLVPEKSTNSMSFYVKPESHEFTRSWPYSGSAVIDMDNSVEFSQVE